MSTEGDKDAFEFASAADKTIFLDRLAYICVEMDKLAHIAVRNSSKDALKKAEKEMQALVDRWNIENDDSVKILMTLIAKSFVSNLYFTCIKDSGDEVAH